MDTFDFSLKKGETSPRQAYRARVPGLIARADAPARDFEVRDISAVGIGLADPEKLLSEGDMFECDLLLQDKVIVPAVRTHVVRVLENGVVGCNFVDLNPRKEARLDKLVLEVQKRIIKLKRAKPEDSE